MSETLMTEAPTATPTEGQGSSEPTKASATAAPVEGQQQQQQQSTSEQTTKAKPAEGEKTEGDKGEAKTSPDNYEFKAPEGREFDATVLEQFSEVAKELKLSQDDAQKVIDKLAPALVEKQQRVLAEARNEWVNSVKSDQEFGGEKLTENLAVAKKALDAFGTPELSKLLNESGLGDHPEIIRAFYRAGKAISEDGRLVTGAKGAQVPADPAKRMFPNQL